MDKYAVWVKELKEIREAFQWTWDNMEMPHTSDHFNIPANGIDALNRLIENSSPVEPEPNGEVKNAAEENIVKALTKRLEWQIKETMKRDENIFDFLEWIIEKDFRVNRKTKKWFKYGQHEYPEYTTRQLYIESKKK